MAKTTKIPKNDIGVLYKKAPTKTKLSFRLALLEAGELDNENYVKRFTDYWQYSKSIGAMPYCMVFAAIQHLGFVYKRTV